MSTSKHNLFQFWNTLRAPDEVAVLMKTWEKEAGFQYRRFDADMADTYISEHFGSRAVSAYRACAVPAMQADFFRYCALYHEGGAYVDADTEASGELAAFVQDSERGVLMNRQKKIANDFLFVRAPRDPLYKRVIEQGIQNIEGRISNNVWMVTGPGIMTHMHLNSEQTEWFDGFDIRPVSEVKKVVLFRQEMAYKETDDDWRQNLKPGGRAVSIFNEVEE